MHSINSFFIIIFILVLILGTVIYLLIARKFTVKFGKVISFNKDSFKVDETCREIVINGINDDALGLVVFRRIWLPYKLRFKHFLPSEPTNLPSVDAFKSYSENGYFVIDEINQRRSFNRGFFSPIKVEPNDPEGKYKILVYLNISLTKEYSYNVVKKH